MKPEYLTKSVRVQVVEAVKAYRKRQSEKIKPEGGKTFDTPEDMEIFFKPYYEKVAAEVDNQLGIFMELCVLEVQYGFVSGYLGGATLNPSGETIVEM